MLQSLQSHSALVMVVGHSFRLVRLTLTLLILDLNVSERCWLKTWFAAIAMKSRKNSWHPGKDGGGQIPPALTGVVSRSCSLFKNRSSHQTRHETLLTSSNMYRRKSCSPIHNQMCQYDQHFNDNRLGNQCSSSLQH